MGMITVNDKNRDDIIRVYASSILDGMDFDTLYSFAYEKLVESKDLMDNEPLENEILEFYPEILDQ
ncbi:MAG: hypothetical protein EBZ49_09115 [Proteobacteria bacterium]|nr:hypothetical protein [Pseudomonadota bacterium]